MKAVLACNRQYMVNILCRPSTVLPIDGQRRPGGLSVIEVAGLVSTVEK
jgi:hypothetical protein